MKLIFCEKKARKPLVSLEKNIAEHFCSAMMSLHYKKDRVLIRRCIVEKIQTSGFLLLREAQL